MKLTKNFRLLAFIFAVIFGVGFSIPSLLQTKGPKISLGLDLQGGLNLLLGVKTDEALKAKYASLASSISYELKQKKVLVDFIKSSDNSLEIGLFDSDDARILDGILSKIEGINITKNATSYRVAFSAEEAQMIKKNALEQAIATIRNRLDQFGLSEPSITQQGQDNILVGLPGIKSAQEEDRARSLISRAAHLQMMAVDEERNHRVEGMSELEAVSYTHLRAHET